MKNKISNMKRIFLTIAVIFGVGICAYAIDYPTYKSSVSRNGAISGDNVQPIQTSQYGVYGNSVLTGGITTTGETGFSGNQTSGPRRAGVSGGGITTEDGYKGWDSEGNVYFWSDDDGCWEPTGEKLNPGDPGDPIPVGSPVLPMLFFALLAAGAVYLRRRKALQA